jgi:hypothetical protein
MRIRQSKQLKQAFHSPTAIRQPADHLGPAPFVQWLSVQTPVGEFGFDKIASGKFSEDFSGNKKYLVTIGLFVFPNEMMKLQVNRPDHKRKRLEEHCSSSLLKFEKLLTACVP